MDNNYLKSPLNYTGNKHRLLEDIYSTMKNKPKTFVDLFSGGGSVGINVDASEVFFIDKNQYVIGLLEFLYNSDFDTLLKGVLEIVDSYKLSCTYKYGYEYYRRKKSKIDNNGYKEFNVKGFNKLRDNYNKIKDKSGKSAYLLLYVLMLYSFNNDIRFNSSNEFNLPCGKTDLNINNVERLRLFTGQKKLKKCKFICGDFREKYVEDIILNSDVVYADPPYIITSAVYNENNGWNSKDEKDLLDLLLRRIKSKKETLLSNVLEKKGKVNNILKNWLDDNNIKYKVLDYNYKSSSYNKKNRDASEKEILVYGGVESC